MRHTALTQNRRRQPAAASMSLFPFLAVLICTMGALILLLVLIARQARLQAARAAAAEAAGRQEEAAKRQKELKEAREDVQWRIEQLDNSRRQTEAQLAEARLVLGHVEDHARRLRDQLDRLKATLGDLDRAGGDGKRQRDELKAELARVKAEISEAERRLADARRAAAERRHSYAVIPYQGPHETYRRPIYVECRADAIILQPEGIVLTVDDFEGPLGPGNPLAAALRAAREHLLARGGFDPKKSGEPYPLLLVRPGGIVAYYTARTAMKEWGSEFGYELIGEDWKLAFQPPDPQLAQVVSRALETARVRQRYLAAAERRLHGSRQPTRYRATRTHGGIVRDDGLPAELDSGYQRRKPSDALGQRFGPEGSSGPGQTSRSEGAIPGRPPSERQHPTTGQGGTPKRPGEWHPNQRVRSLAKSRGPDWALPEWARGSVPITRPIRIDCHQDRLVILPASGPHRSKSIPLGSRTADSMNQLVSAVWGQIESWGIAGSGMYWRPILNVHVAPGAEQRYTELSTLLDDSGLKVERKE